MTGNLIPRLVYNASYNVQGIRALWNCLATA